MKQFPTPKPAQRRQPALVEPTRLAAIQGGDMRHPTIEPTDITAASTTTIS